ncbi:hypothetical protein Tco_0447852 [Tanacetum coccineum]
MPSEENERAAVRKTKTMIENPKLNNTWKLYTDWAMSSDGSGAGLMLISPEGKEYTYALHFGFKTTKQRTEIALDRCDSTKNGKLEKPGNFHRLSVNGKPNKVTLQKQTSNYKEICTKGEGNHERF